MTDPTRRLLVERLLTKGPATATVLAETTPLTRQAVLKHLQQTGGLQVTPHLASLIADAPTDLLPETFAIHREGGRG